MVLAKETAGSNSTFLPKVANVLPRNSSDYIVLENWTLVSFMSVDIFLEEAFYFNFLSCCYK